MRKISFLILASFTLSISSCNMILMPSKQKVNVSTTNENSVVFAENEEIGRGTNFTTKIKKSGAKQIVIQTPEYKDEHIVIMPQKKSPLFYPFLALDIPLMYGLLFSGVPKTYIYDKNLKFENSIKLENRIDSQKYINLSSISLNIKDKKKDLQDYYINSKGDIYANIDKAVANRATSMEKAEVREQKKSQKKGKKNYLVNDNEVKSEDTEFSESIFKTLKKTGYIDTVNKVFQDNNNTIIIEGEIQKADLFNVNRTSSMGVLNPMIGGYQKLGVGIQWFIKNSYGEILDSVYVYEYSGDFKPNYSTTNSKSELIYDDAVDRSYFKLRKTEEFLKNIEVNSDFTSKDEKMTISEPKAVVKEVADASLASVIIKRKDKGHGSGFAISNDGYILTNFHVIAGKTIDKQESIKVILSNGEELEATVVRFNRARDIALLKVDYKFEKAFLLKSTKDFKNLQEVYTIGAPKSIELGQTVTLGLISNERKTNNNNVLQLSMSINGGNSGGPLFDKTGLLHGVIQAKLVGYSTEGVGFAIPSYMIPEYLNLSIKK